VKDLGVHGFLEPRPHAYSLIEHFKSLHDFEEHDKKPYVAELKALGPKYGIHYSARFYQSAI
jgi:quinol monooxygenase YgiN